MRLVNPAERVDPGASGPRSSSMVIETNPNIVDGNDHVRNAVEGTLARYFDFYAP
jgi:hypothetical protein